MKNSIASISGSNFGPSGFTGGPVPFELPVRARKVRDSGSLLVMLAYLGFLAYIIWDGIYVKETDINLIVHGHDSYGNICGRNNKPLKFAPNSGRNYVDKPYTKYTLINSQFERYTLDLGRAKFGELVYVKENEQLQKQVQRKNLQQHQQSREQPKLKQETLPANGSSVGTSRINQLKFQDRPSAANRVLLINSSSLLRPTQTIRLGSLSNKQLDFGNDSDRYEHMLVTPVSVLTTSRGINQNEVANQLLYLTECVSGCPGDHVELVFYRCMPNNWRFSLFPNAINVTRTFIDDILTDVSHCYRELIYTFSLALVLSLGLLILLRYLASIIIWSCITLLVSIFIALACYSWLTFYYHLMDLNQLLPHDSIFSEKLANSDRWLIGSIFFTFVAFAAIALVLFMRKRILLVTMLFRESGKAIADMPLLLLQPLLTFAALIGIMAAWLLGLICLQSM